MLNKILLALGVVVAISALGSALTCNVCQYTSAQLKAQQKCNSSNTVNCTAGYCYTATYTQSNGIVVVIRNCDSDPADKFCPDAAKTCSDKTKLLKLKSCASACCKTDNCNNYTPNSASGIMATKFILCLMVLAGFLFA